MSRTKFYSALCVFLCAFFYALIILGMAPGKMTGQDSLWHFSTSRQIWEGDVVPSMAASLPLSIYKEWDVDHYWGFHLLMAPFGAFEDPEVGMKFASAVCFALVFLSLFLFLRARGVKWAWVLATVPIFLSTVDWRYLQLRGGTLTAALTFLLLQVAFFWNTTDSKRRWALLGIGYVGMLSYQGCIILLPLHIAGLSALWLFRRKDLARRQIWDPGFTALGLAGGLTLNPYMDASFSSWKFAYYHIVNMGTDRLGLYKSLVIGEFKPFPLSMLSYYPEWGVVVSILVIALMYSAWCLCRGKTTKDMVVFGAVTMVGVVLCSRAMRSYEFAVPWGVAFMGIVGREFYKNYLEWFHARHWVMASAVSVVVVALVCGVTWHGYMTWQGIVNDGNIAKSTDMYKGAKPLLGKYPDSVVLNVLGEDYTTLRWESPASKYIQGLSQYFTWPDQGLYEDLKNIKNKVLTLPKCQAIELLDRFWARGVRLVAVRLLERKSEGLVVYERPSAFYRFAMEHQDILRPVFLSPTNEAAIFLIDREHLDMALSCGKVIAAKE